MNWKVLLILVDDLLCSFLTGTISCLVIVICHLFFGEKLFEIIIFFKDCFEEYRYHVQFSPVAALSKNSTCFITICILFSRISYLIRGYFFLAIVTEDAVVDVPHMLGEPSNKAPPNARRNTLKPNTKTHQNAHENVVEPDIKAPHDVCVRKSTRARAPSSWLKDYAT